MQAQQPRSAVKDDESSIRQLFHVIKSVAEGGGYFSPGAWEKVKPGQSSLVLTSRQLEALSVSAAYPDLSTYALAQKLAVSASTFRNLLSGAYKRLGVSTRTAAIVRQPAATSCECKRCTRLEQINRDFWYAG